MKNLKILTLFIILLITGMFVGCIALTTPETNEGGVISGRSSSGTMVEKIIFHSNRDGNYEVYIMDPDGSNQERLTANSAFDAVWDLSPDGTKILFYSDRDSNVEIYIMNIDGSNQENLTNNSSVDKHSTFSPDGSKITFISNRNGYLNVYVMDISGSNPTMVTNLQGILGSPIFTPDGNQILFYYRDISHAGNSWYNDLYIVDVDGLSPPTKFLELGGSDAYPRFSPDESKIIFNNCEPHWKNQIYEMDADGTNVVKITTGTSWENKCPYFSPDGLQIVFYAEGYQGTDELYIMNNDGSNWQQLTNNYGVINSGAIWGYVVLPKKLKVEADVDPKSGTPPHQVQCVGFVSGGLTPYTYQWEFGDGSWSEKGMDVEHRDVFHTYLNSGKYKPILHVEDSEGKKGKCKAGVVTVENKIPFIDGSVFANKQWNIDTDESPGSNQYSDSIENIWLDELDQLHFKMTKDKETKKWKCVEIYSDQQGWGYGKYEFEIEVISDGKIDENVVIGLFTYDSEASEEYFREIDFEYSKWGIPKDENSQFVIQYVPNSIERFDIPLENYEAKVSFDWREEEVIFYYQCGDQENEIILPKNGEICKPPIPGNERVYMNLWLHNGNPYNEDKMEKVELVIKDFKFTK